MRWNKAPTTTPLAARGNSRTAARDQGCEKAKSLLPLRRGVRGVLTNECYGTIGYAAKNPEIMKRLVAALNWDTVGRYQESATAVFRQHRCADASASVIDTLIGMLLDQWLAKALPFSKKHAAICPSHSRTTPTTIRISACPARTSTARTVSGTRPLIRSRRSTDRRFMRSR